MSNYTVEIINEAQAISAEIHPALYIGPTGLTPVLTIGTVEFGEVSSATITGTPEAPVLNLVLERGLTGPVGPIGPIGPVGPIGETGVGILSFERTSGNGTPGSTDVYTLTMTDGQTASVDVYQGRDGLGTGDMHTSAYDTDGDGVIDRADVADALAEDATITLEQVEGLDDALALKADIQLLIEHTEDHDNPHHVTAEQVIGLEQALQNAAPINSVLYTGVTEAAIATPGIDADLLDGVTRAYLVGRENHTGTQPIETIEGLPDVVALIRRITVSTELPTETDGQDGDLWIVAQT